jgi:hypothetical protein
MDNQNLADQNSQPSQLITSPSQTSSIYPNASTGPLAEPPASSFQQTRDETKRTYKRPIIIFVILLLIVAGTALGFFLLKPSNKAEKTSSLTTSPITKNDISVNTKLASLDTTNWQSYSDATMKVSFKYPASLPVKNSQVKLYPPKAPTTAIQSEVSVEAEIGSTGTSLIDVITYTPGSPNDKMSSSLSNNKNLINYEAKSVNVSGISGNCEYYAPKYDESQKHFSCKFNKDNLIYSVGGGVPTSDIANLFKDVDFWTISQKILETLKFTT